MSLTEQRAQYASKLQAMYNARKDDIEAKVVAYKAQLEATLVTPEMQQLTDVIRALDVVIGYEGVDNTVATKEADVDASDVFCAESECSAAEKSDDESVDVAPVEETCSVRQRVEAAQQGRAGMPNIVLPDRK